MPGPRRLPLLPAWLASRFQMQGQHAADETLEFLADRVEGNLLAAHQDPDAIRGALTLQLYAPVRWIETVEKLAALGATRALEVETPALVRAAVTDVHLESLEVRRADGSRAGFLHTSPEYAMKRLLAAGVPEADLARLRGPKG